MKRLIGKQLPSLLIPDLGNSLLVDLGKLFLDDILS